MLVLLIAIQVKAQITTSEVKVEQTGNATSILGPVGIGTLNTTNGVLTVNGTAPSNLLRLENDGMGNEASLRFRAKSNSGNFLHADLTLFASGNNEGYIGFKVPHDNNINSGYDMVVNHLGNLGIGTITPFSSLNNKGLHIDHGGHTSIIIGDGTNNGGIIQSSDNSRRVFIGSNIYDDNDLSWKNFTNGPSAAVDVIGSSGRIRFLTSTTSNGYNPSNIRMTINNDGNIGIGHDSPAYKLEVNGTVRATTFSAVSPPSWPDYVFEKEYQIPTIEEVENYIIENKHLPEIPSEDEVAKTGINLGEMNAKLLQKIEELTLYMIDINKQLKSQSQRMELFEQENTELKKEVLKLKLK